MVFELILAILLNPSSAVAGEHERRTPRAGIYMSMGFGGQYTNQSPALDVNFGLGIRVFFIGIGAEAHYLYNYLEAPGIFPASTAEGLYLGRFEIFPSGNFKIAGLGGEAIYSLGQNQNPPPNQTVAGLRLAYEGHIGPVFSMEPAFSFLQTIGPTSYQSYLFTLTFGLWNEAFLSTLMYSLISGAMHR